MNKKFSTLVAALLVSGASYAVVSQYGTPVLTSSPIATAAAANLKAVSAEDVFSKATAEIEVQEWTYSHTAWTVETVENGFKLKNGNFYVGIKANGEVYGTKVADDAAVFTYENYTLNLKGEAFTINEQTFSLFTVPTTEEEKSNLLMAEDLNGVTEVYVAAYQEPAKFANGETSYVSGTAVVAPAVAAGTSDYSEFTLTPEGLLTYTDNDVVFYAKLNQEESNASLVFTSNPEEASKLTINTQYNSGIIQFAETAYYICFTEGSLSITTSGTGAKFCDADDQQITAIPEENTTVTIKSVGESSSDGLVMTAGTAANAENTTTAIENNDAAQWILEESDEDAQYYYTTDVE